VVYVDVWPVKPLLNKVFPVLADARQGLLVVGLEELKNTPPDVVAAAAVRAPVCAVRRTD